MRIKTYPCGPLDANNYLVIDEASKEAVLIDCSAYNQNIVDEVQKQGIKVKYIFLTHGHFDHILGINDMKKALNAEVIVPDEDLILIENANQHAKMFGEQITEKPHNDKTYNDVSDLSIGDKKINIIKTPGHTEGGVSILIDDNLFSGDTLFKDSFGRTDLYGGSIRKLVNSIVNVLFNLPENTVVYPGHGPSSTIGYEKNNNDIMHYVK